MRAAFVSIALVTSGCDQLFGLVAVDDGDGGAPSDSAFAVDMYTSATMQYQQKLDFPHPVGSGNGRLLLVVLATSYAGSTAANVTYGGTPLLRVGAQDAPASDGRVELWQLADPVQGVATVSITLADADSSLVAGAISFTGVDPVDPLGPFAAGSDVSASPAVMIPSATDELVIGSVMFNCACTTLAPDMDQLQRWNAVTYDIAAAAGTRPGAPTATTMSWTISDPYNDSWVATGISVRPAR